MQQTQYLRLHTLYLFNCQLICVWNIQFMGMLIPGQFCTEDVNECDLMPNSCQNGGTCLNTHGGYNCVCVNGWTGDDCSENIDDCADAACHAGATCHDRVASFLCECPPGRTGAQCFFSHLREAVLLFQSLQKLNFLRCIFVLFSSTSS